jgi:hypothetical protein
MLAIFWFVFGAGLATLAILAGVSLRARQADVIGRGRPVLDDVAIEQIIEQGEIWVDEDDPLDLDEIDDEEERFWSESWDEPQGEW